MLSTRRSDYTERKNNMWTEWIAQKNRRGSMRKGITSGTHTITKNRWNRRTQKKNSIIKRETNKRKGISRVEARGNRTIEVTFRIIALETTTGTTRE